ncbi:MAG: hypothetical protein QOJ19_617 [Acidimicrobiia bacterium]|jgi:hypothetical protein|nr:hypothetical protein [Acidimicrobiia bacterium]
MSVHTLEGLWGRKASAALVGIPYGFVDRWERAGLMRSTVPARGQGRTAALDRTDLGALAILAALAPYCGFSDGIAVPAWGELQGLALVGGAWWWDPPRRALLPAKLGPIPTGDPPAVALYVDVDRINRQLEGRLPP